MNGSDPSRTPSLNHHEFVARDRAGGEPYWGVQDLFLASRLAHGRLGELGLRLISSLIFLPAFLLVGSGLWRGEYEVLAWLPLCWAAYNSARTDLNLSQGCLVSLLGILPVGLSLVLARSRPISWMGLPLLPWVYFATSLVRSLTVYDIGCHLRDSAELYQTFLDADALFFLPSRAVTPAAKPSSDAIT
jgi:hypothetical protein